MFGFLNVNKPAGPTSFAVVAGVRRRAGRKIKVGHAGTLDPFARGVLVICLGPATRLASYVQAAPKRYLATITLGATSATDDVEGPITPNPKAEPPAEPVVRNAAGRFVGPIQQVPPAFSAVHVDGRRAYKLARKGRTPDLPARGVTVHAIDVVRYAWPLLEIDVRCGSGTYIRSLARDVGAALGVGGYCSSLTRTEVGPFTLAHAVDLDEADPAGHIVKPLVALAGMPTMTLDEAQAARIAVGQAVTREASIASGLPRSGEIALIGTTGGLLAIGELSFNGRSVRPMKVFVTR